MPPPESPRSRSFSEERGLSSAGVLKVIQVTDSHLFATEDGRLLGMNTRNSLGMVVDLISAEYSDFDILLATGDLSQDHSPESYRAFEAALTPLSAPETFWYPGNHDHVPTMQGVLGADSPVMTRVVRRGAWQLVLLDSTIPGKVPGHLGAAELEILDQALAEKPGLHSLVCFHHQPVPVHCKWLDTQMIKDATALFEVLDRHDNVRGVLWGHVHQEVDRERNGVRLLATPSTCVQFAPGSEDFGVDDEPPGFRWLTLQADGSIETGVVRVPPFDFEIDYSVKGY